MEPRSSECGDQLQELPPTNWLPAWGPAPQWSHLDGESLCRVMSDGGYRPCEPVFI